MTPQQEAVIERKIEKHFQGHRELLPGRDYRFNVFRFRDEDDKFRARFDKVFPDAPGSPEWFEKKFGGVR